MKQPKSTGRLGVLALAVLMSLSVNCDDDETKNDSDCRTTSIIERSTEEIDFEYEQNTLSELDGSSLVVMTRNLYLGANIFGVFTASDADELFDEVDGLFNDAVASEFINRARGIAHEVSLTDPDVIGLQEVTTYRSGEFDLLTTFTENAECVEIDFLALLQEALAEKGLDYTVAAQIENTDIELTDLSRDLRLTDHDAILVKTELEVSDVDTDTFGASVPVTVVDDLIDDYGDIDLIRGYTAVTVTKNSQSYRIYNTHLEVGGDPFEFFQIQQANEFAVLMNDEPTNIPVIALGDFNINSTDGSNYGKITTDAGLTDAWQELVGLAEVTAGQVTCCTSDDLTDASSFGSLIDLVLYRDGDSLNLSPQAGIITMQSEDERIETSDGRSIFPSDHRGMVIGF